MGLSAAFYEDGLRHRTTIHGSADRGHYVVDGRFSVVVRVETLTHRE